LPDGRNYTPPSQTFLKFNPDAFAGRMIAVPSTATTTGNNPNPLACIIRERHATEGFGRQRIAEEEDGSVKLMRGTWLQALQAHTIEVATILGRGFALCSFGSGENGNSSGERS